MRLLRLADVPTGERDRVFRYSRAWALVVACAVIGAAGALTVLGWRARSGLAYYIAGVLLLGLVVLRRLILARFRPSNWLVRMSDEGLLVQFRSYLNYHFAATDPTVVFIPYREIDSVRLVRQRRDIPYRDEPGTQVARVSQQRRRLVELALTGDTAPLVQALADEAARPAPKGRRWYGAAATRYKHYPVRMASPSVLQLEWNVVPSPHVLFDALRRHTNIGTPVEVSQDYVHLAGLSREEQEKRLLELAETGQTIAAIHMARELYSYDLAQARAFVEGLRGGITDST
jgi:hypothetical protein